MSYHFYYPYYSARNVNPAPLHDLTSAIQRYSRLEEEQAEIQLAVRLKQQQMAAQRIRQYEEELKQKQKFYQQLPSIPIQAGISNYGRNQSEIQGVETGRAPEDSRTAGGHQSFQPLTQRQNHSLKSGKPQHIINTDEAYYERRAQQYQQQLLQKIQKNQKQQSLKALRKKNEETKKKMKEKKNIREVKKLTENCIKIPEQNVIINKKPTQSKAYNLFRNPLIQIKTNCLVDDRNYSRYQTIDVNQLRPKINKIFNHSDKKNNTVSVYQIQKKKNSHSRKKSNSVVHAKYDTVFHLGGNTKPQKAKVESLSSRALKKINNRLNLSIIVFKDSRWPNERHLIHHLLNTYENQQKGRKEIKDKINNNPKILKKHALVVSSR